MRLCAHLQRDNSLQLSWECEEQLFRQEMEDADDLRLSVRLRSRCMEEKRRFCKDVEPGECFERGGGEEGAQAVIEVLCACARVCVMQHTQVMQYRATRNCRRVCVCVHVCACAHGTNHALQGRH